EDFRIYMIDKYRTLVLRLCSTSEFFQPEVVGNDDMVGECRRPALHHPQQKRKHSLARCLKFARKKFRHDVVNIENHWFAREFRIPRGEDHEVRHVMDMNDIIRLMTMGVSHPS